jgi:hypothetical protein
MGVSVLMIGFLLFILFPICLVLFNKNFSSKAKLVGVLVSLFFSWVGFIVFFVLMAVQKRA